MKGSSWFLAYIHLFYSVALFLLPSPVKRSRCILKTQKNHFKVISRQYSQLQLRSSSRRQKSHYFPFEWNVFTVALQRIQVMHNALVCAPNVMKQLTYITSVLASLALCWDNGCMLSAEFHYTDPTRPDKVRGLCRRPGSPTKSGLGRNSWIWLNTARWESGSKKTGRVYQCRLYTSSRRNF